MNDLLERVRQGDLRVIARAITQVENEEEGARRYVGALHPYTGSAHLIGVTGPPGCGKSTLVNELVKRIHSSGQKVAVVAVDPSSPFSGGSFLGDRVRMSEMATREGVFVRSMASRGSLGGLSVATAAVTKILDAAGYELIIVETVGTGQAEVDIASLAHTILVVEAPGGGDDVQANKAGILEIADILVVNKMDRPGAENTVRALEMMVRFGHPSQRFDSQLERHHSPSQSAAHSCDEPETAAWEVPVLQTNAREGLGVDELMLVINDHYTYLRHSGEWERREFEHTRREIDGLLQHRVLSQLKDTAAETQKEALVGAVAKREIAP
ncbi:MAG: methylmalonyl Co-A mutase-associated GTPase MeaB, partial [Candidatus Promineifilaceae bacterium]